MQYSKLQKDYNLLEKEFCRFMKKILVLGMGSVGSEIAYSFSNDYEVTCVDHGKNFDIIRRLLPQVRLVQGDVNDNAMIIKEAENKDIIFYCIDTGGVIDSNKYPSKYYDINVTNFGRLINSLSTTSVHFFLFSSVFVYPDMANITEQTQPKPETTYGELRMRQEQILEDSDLEFTILRLSNIFGYGHFFNLGNRSAIEKFIDYVFVGKKITLNGDGSQIVDYLYKKNLMDLLLRLVKTPTGRRVYNVSGGQSRPILEIAEIINELAYQEFGKRTKIIKLDEEMKLPNSPTVIPKKVMKETGWKPSNNLPSQIKEMLDIYNSKHERKI